MTTLTVIIVSYNCRADLDACLRSLAAAPPRVPYTVTVVDNGSTDGTPAFVRAQWPKVVLIEPGRNLGFGPANNLGLRSTTGTFVLFLNPDALVRAGAIDRLLDHLAAHANVAAAGPRIVDGDGRAELSFGSMMTPWAELRQKVLVHGHARSVPLVHGHVEHVTRVSKPVDWVSGACLLARRADLDAVGGFDERFFLYTEDVDLCAAFRARGRTVWFLADAEIVHRRGRSGASAPAATRRAYRRSHVAFYEKHHPRWAPLLKAYLKLRGQQADSP